MFTVQSLLIMTLLPAGAAAALLLAARAVAPARRPAIGGAVLATAFAAAFVVRHGWPWASSWQALEAWQCLPWLAAAAALLSLVVPASRGGRRTAVVVWLLRLVLIAAALPAMLQSYLRHTWSAGESAAWLAALGIGLLVYWIAVERLDRRAADGASSMLAAAVVAMSTGVCLLLTGSQKVAELAIMLGSACAAAALLELFRRPQPNQDAGGAPSSADVAVAAPLLAAIWLNGRFYAETPGWMPLVLAAAWCAGLCMVVLPPMKRWRRWPRRLAAGGATVLVAAGAIVPAILAFQPDPYGY